MENRKDRITIESEQELQEIFEQYYRPLCYYVSRFIKSGDRIKDIVQDVFVACWNKKLDFPNHYALKAYLYSSVYHSCIDQIKLDTIHNRHHDNIRRKSPLEDPDYLETRIETESLEQIFRAIESLPKQCMTVFKLSYIEGKSVDDVAEELNLSPNTVKTQRARAKKLLQERLKHLYNILAILFIG